jgi:Phospholipase_D-nuclease N-terminal
VDWDVFWSVLFVLFIVIPVMMIWVFAMVDLFQRSDLSGLGKVTWMFGIIFFPVVGTLVYYLVRPRVILARYDSPAEVAGTLAQLKYLHDSGDLSDADYDRERSRLLMAS